MLGGTAEGHAVGGGRFTVAAERGGQQSGKGPNQAVAADESWPLRRGRDHASARAGAPGCHGDRGERGVRHGQLEAGPAAVRVSPGVGRWGCSIGRSMTPVAMAWNARAVREGAASLRRAEATWLATVLGDSTRAWEICRSVCPTATSATT